MWVSLLMVTPSLLADTYVQCIANSDIKLCLISEVAHTLLYRQTCGEVDCRIPFDNPKALRRYLLFPNDIMKPWFEVEPVTQYKRIRKAFEILKVVCRKKSHAGRILAVHSLELARLDADLIVAFGAWADNNWKQRGSYSKIVITQALLAIAGDSSDCAPASF